MRKAFTLIELLVVISIIALLIAILLPVLSSARASAVQAQCASNMHTIAVAYGSYHADHKGELFREPFNKDDPNQHQAHFQWGGRTMSWEYGDFPAPYSITNPWDRPLNQYMDSDENNTTPAYICPADPPGDTKQWAPFTSEPESFAYYTTQGTSYQYNAQLVGSINAAVTGTPSPRYRYIDQVRRTTEAILVYEWPAYDVPQSHSRPAWWTDFPRWSFHDFGGRGAKPFETDRPGNMTTFIDGHAEYLTYERGQWETDAYTFTDK